MKHFFSFLPSVLTLTKVFIKLVIHRKAIKIINLTHSALYVFLEMELCEMPNQKYRMK